MHIVKVRILNIFRALCCRLFHPEARKISFFSAVCIGVWAPLFAADLPHGGSVTGGQAVITQQTHSVEVFQSSDRVSLLWDEFSIGAVCCLFAFDFYKRSLLGFLKYLWADRNN